MLNKSLCALVFTGLFGANAFAADKCTIELTGNDQMQYDKKEIKLPAACAKSDIKLNFKHIGTLPVAAMGHNVVIIDDGKLPAIQARYATAGADPVKIDANSEQLKSSGEVLAYTKLVGGSGTDSVVISKGKFAAGKKYQYFCSFPGHFSIMIGSLEFEKSGTNTATSTTNPDKKK